MPGIDLNTMLMLHLNDNVMDTSTNNLSIFNNAKGVPTLFSGTQSAIFNGSSAYLSAPDESYLNPGSGNFTIDCWINMTTLPSSGSNYAIAVKSDNEGYNTYQFWVSNVSGTYYLNFQSYTGDSLTIATISGVYSFSANTWYHVALVRNGTNISLYAGVTGTTNTLVVSTITSVAIPTISYPLYFGLYDYVAGSAWYFNGSIEEIRYSNIARWTTTFIPSSTPYTSDANTELLLHLNGTVLDSSSNNLTITNNAVTFTSNLISFPSIIPGTQSAIFNGSSAYLSAPNNSAYNFSGDFTVECWIYLNTGFGNSSIIGNLNQNTSYLSRADGDYLLILMVVLILPLA